MALPRVPVPPCNRSLYRMWLPGSRGQDEPGRMGGGPAEGPIRGEAMESQAE